MFVDLAGLKDVNDREGHAAGDALINRAAHALQTAVRADDLVLRWGGDEFVAVCPGADPGTVARAVAAALKTTGVAATVGCTPVSPGEALEAAVARADADMYRQREARVDRRELTASLAEVVAQELGGADGFGPARPADLPTVQHLVRTRILHGVVPLALRRGWYRAYPDGLQVLRRGGDIAGVLHHTPLRPDVVDDLAARRRRERDLSHADIDPASPCTHVQVLAATDTRAAAMLLLGAMRLLGGYRRITALATPPDGVRLCKRLGFRVAWAAEDGSEEFSELLIGGR
ncbi:MAG: GGDEF domain-containing protein [Thermaerobacter sp.]|nr:GGDEF domain-containing protein [Thermaerobacter sp.]